MIDLDTLALELTVPGYIATINHVGDRLFVAWTGLVPDPVIVDRRTDGSAAEATILVLPDDGGSEWERLMVEPSVMGAGIFTACLGLSEASLRAQGLWPAYVNATANNAEFYQSAGFVVSDDRPGYLVKDQAAAEAWVADHQ